jgi:hypothetical protein
LVAVQVQIAVEMVPLEVLVVVAQTIPQTQD